MNSRYSFFLGCLGVLLVVGPWGVPRARADESALPAASASDTAQEPPQTITVPSLDLSFRDPFHSFLPFDQDLFKVAVREEQKLGLYQEEIPEEEILDLDRFRVNGLVWGIEEARAIIDGGIYGVGDIIADATIVRIDREGILFEYVGREFLLKRTGNSL